MGDVVTRDLVWLPVKNPVCILGESFLPEDTGPAFNTALEDPWTPLQQPYSISRWAGPRIDLEAPPGRLSNHASKLVRRNNTSTSNVGKLACLVALSASLIRRIFISVIFFRSHRSQ